MPYKDPDKGRERNRARGRSRSPEYNSEVNRRYREKHREQINAKQRENGAANVLKYKHGMLPEDRAAMWSEHRGACYLCGDPLRDGTRQVHIDHDHTCCPQGYSCATCRRGLACHSCNLLIGLAKDDPGRLERIAANLRIAQAGVDVRKAARPVQEELPLNVSPIRREVAG